MSSRRGKVRIEIPGRAWEPIAAAPMLSPGLLDLFERAANGTGSYWYAWVWPAEAEPIGMALRWVYQQHKLDQDYTMQLVARRCQRIADRITIDIRVAQNDPAPGW